MGMENLNNIDVRTIFETFVPVLQEFDYEKITSGHINNSFKLINGEEAYVLQEINTEVFHNPDIVMHNMSLVADYLKVCNYPHRILTPVLNDEDNFLSQEKWRLFPFFEGTKTFEVVHSPEQAYEAAAFLSEFHYYLRGFNIDGIRAPIPGFLDFNSRLIQFEKVLKIAEKERLSQAAEEIKLILLHRDILRKWKKLEPFLPKRIIHADPKISNFLFDGSKSNAIIALIDWDTIMQGTILYDFGDMVRSYTNLKKEDAPEKGGNFSEENYKSLQAGFLSHLHEELVPVEIKHMKLAAEVVVYVQAIRFLSDYLNNDKYYAIHYPEQNLNRTVNQLNLLEELLRAETSLPV